jgi:hypothetical protein
MKRDQLIRQLRKDAKKAGGELTVDEARGKGGHYVLRFGGKFSVIQSGEITPKMEHTIRKQLGLLCIEEF